MFTRMIGGIISPVILSFVALLGLSGCFEAESGLLDGEESVDPATFFGDGRQVFAAEIEGGIMAFIVDDFDEGRRIIMVGADVDEALPVPRITAHSDPLSASGTVFIASLEDERKAFYFPIVPLPGGFEIAMTGGRAADSAELLALARAALQESERLTFRVVLPTEQDDVIRQATETQERQQREREEQAALRREQAEQQRLEREKLAQQRAEEERLERERQEREREERERQELASFRTDGYAIPALFEAIHRGEMRGYRSADHGLYLNTFAQMFYNAENDQACRAVITLPARGALAGKAMTNSLDMMFRPLMDAHRRGSAGRDEAFVDGLRAGGQGSMSVIQAELFGQRDAQLFYNRHGCSTVTAVRFFTHFNIFALQN